MFFTVIAHDAADPDAADRRVRARPDHVANLRKLVASGQVVDGGAILDDDQRVVGSMLLCEFHDRAALDVYLHEEPYVVADVWARIDVLPLRRIDKSTL